DRPREPAAGAQLELQAQESEPREKHLVVPENTKGWSYRRLFADYLKGARKITVRDPYVRHFYQVRNMMEFLAMVHDLVPDGDEVGVHLITQADAETCEKQDEFLNQIVSNFDGSRVAFTWKVEANPN